uniref:Secreted frizzled-related protein 2 n=1 Tax=Cyprinus carpio TaxID=7962 RepID=A0A8C2L004_CYPCA
MILAYLALLVALSLPGYLDAFHDLYAFDQPELFQGKSNCKPIPANLLLCHDIEYTDMRLPNLLGHETMNEILQQASSWTPLVQKQCHPDTKMFLCSLFAPVCLDDLDEPIQPCRSLCENVKSGCAPVMAAFGFPWPDMLDCNRFPLDNDLCIPPAGADVLVPVTKEGEVCVHPITRLHSNCVFGFVCMCVCVCVCVCVFGTVPQEYKHSHTAA